MRKLFLSLIALGICFFGFSQSALPGKCGVDCVNAKMLDLKQIPESTDTQFIAMRFIAFPGAPAQLDSLVKENLATLNDAFSNSVVFIQDEPIIKSEVKTILPELYQMYVENSSDFDTIRIHSKKGNINVFLMPTIEDTLKGQVLLGFTPIYQDWFEGFERVSPRMDNLFVSYDGLFKGSTLTHEMGHFMGLAHPFQMDFEERKELGLAEEKAICTNFMNYNCFVNEFTGKQINLMQYFAKTYRNYLNKK